MGTDGVKLLKDWVKEDQELAKARGLVAALEASKKTRPTMLKLARADEQKAEAEKKAQAASAQAGAQKQQPLSKLTPKEQPYQPSGTAAPTATQALAEITAGGPQGPATQPAAAATQVAGSPYTAPANITSTTQQETIRHGRIMPNLYGPMRSRTSQQTTRPNVLTAEGAARLNMQQEARTEARNIAMSDAMEYAKDELRLDPVKAAEWAEARLDGDMEGQVKAIGNTKSAATLAREDEARKGKRDALEQDLKIEGMRADNLKAWTEIREAVLNVPLVRQANWVPRGDPSTWKLIEPDQRTVTLERAYDKNGVVIPAQYGALYDVQTSIMHYDQALWIPRKGKGAFPPWGEDKPPVMKHIQKLVIPLAVLHPNAASIGDLKDREEAIDLLVATELYVRGVDEDGRPVLKRNTEGYEEELLHRGLDFMQLLAGRQAMLQTRSKALGANPDDPSGYYRSDPAKVQRAEAQMKQGPPLGPPAEAKDLTPAEEARQLGVRQREAISKILSGTGEEALKRGVTGTGQMPPGTKEWLKGILSGR